MTATYPGLLAELIALPDSSRLARLELVDFPERVLIALSEEADGLAAAEIGQAMAASEMLITLANALDVPRARVEARGTRAMTLAYAGRLEESLAICAEALVIAEAAELIVEAARTRLTSVHALARLGRFDEAIVQGSIARDALARAGERALAAKADISLGAVHDMREEPAEALRHYDRALAAVDHDRSLVAQIETNRGIALMGLDDFEAAGDAFRGAVEAFSGEGLSWAAAIAEGNLAHLATRQGRLERALHHFERARRCLEVDQAPADLARLLAEQADALAVLGMPREALDAFEGALPQLEVHGLVLEAAQAKGGLGRVQMQLGRLEEAGERLAEAAAALEALGQTGAGARLDLVRAELALKLGRHDDARLLAQASLEQLAGQPSDTSVAREVLARLALTNGDLPAAGEHVALALPIAERLDLAAMRGRLLHARGRLARERGDPDAALRDLREAVAQIERVRGTLQAERFRTAFQGAHLSIYEDAVLAALDGGPARMAEAFALMERAKGRALLDLISGALDLVDAADRGRDDPAEAALLLELARIRGELNWHSTETDEAELDGASRAAGETRRATIVRLEGQFDALQDRLAASRGIAGLFAPPIALDGALRVVPDAAALVEYFMAGSEVMAFVLHDGQATVVRGLADARDIEERVRRVHFQIGRATAGAGRMLDGPRADRLLAEMRRELGELYDLLIAPLGSAVQVASRLIVAPHGALHMLPFHALWNGQQYLIESQEVVSVPSASVLAQLATVRSRPATRTTALVMGVPDALAPRIEAETEHVARSLGARAWVGPKATTERLASDGEFADVIHLACHGRFMADRPLASGLKLADRWMTVRDIYALRLNASLITLSGCETGRATVSGGDELMGLTRGFFAAGASALLISLWVANDESTTDLMVEFYDAYQRGVAPATALRFAQRSLLERRPHPAFWAPFALGGHT